MIVAKSALDELFRNPEILEASLLLNYKQIDHQFLARWKPYHEQEFWGGVIHLITNLKTNRETRDVVLIFPATQLIILTFDDYLLIITASRLISVSLLASLGRSWLQSYYRIQNPAPFEDIIPQNSTKTSILDDPIDPLAWNSFRAKIETILSKVLSFSVCIQLLEQSVLDLGFDLVKGIPPNRFHELGIHVIRKVPNRSKQETLLADFEELMNRK